MFVREELPLLRAAAPWLRGEPTLLRAPAPWLRGGPTSLRAWQIFQPIKKQAARRSILLTACF